MTAPADILVPTLTQGHTMDWSPGTTYQPNMDVIDRGGIWRCVAEHKGSQPISGNPDWTLVAGTPYVDTLLDPVALSTPPFNVPGFTGPGIVVIPAPGAGLVAIPLAASPSVTDGDPWEIDPKFQLQFVDATTNVTDIYVWVTALADDPLVQPWGYDLANAGSLTGNGYPLTDNQKIVAVAGQDPTGGALGTRSLQVRTYYWIVPYTPVAPTFFLISAVDQGAKTFTVNGDASALVAGQLISVVGSTGNNRGYTVVSATFSVSTTDIIVSQAIASATADGWVKVV